MQLKWLRKLGIAVDHSVSACVGEAVVAGTVIKLGDGGCCTVVHHSSEVYDLRPNTPGTAVPGVAG